MKRKISKSVLLVLAACFACVLALGTTLANAEEPAKYSITVNFQEGSGNNVDQNDFSNVTPQVNVYLLANATLREQDNTYIYDFVDSFRVESLEDAYKEASTIPEQSTNATTNNSALWKSMVDVAKGIIQDSNISPTTQGLAKQKIDINVPGLYLVDIQDASSNINKYSFTSAIVAIPNKVTEQGDIPLSDTTQPGKWLNDVTIAAKPPVPTPLHGTIRIVKTIQDFSGEGATFVYQITKAHPEDTSVDFKDAIAIVQFKEGKTASTEITVPAGIELVITEVNTGARFNLVSPNDVPVTATPGEVTEVPFENAPNNSGTGGHGIENHFVYSEKEGWVRTVNSMYAGEDVTENVVEK